jgi:CelD/BcsL family acetyltransferase involved in cellulose biosynthesis
MMEHVIEKDRVSRIDYLTGDDDYKKNWMSVRKERHGIAAYNPRTLSGGGMLLGHILKNLAKKISKSSATHQ